MKRIILTILGIVVALNCLMAVNMAYAGGGFAAPTQTISNTTFNVREFLKLGTESQQQAYFENTADPTRPPIANLIVLTIEFATKIIGSIAMIILIISGFVMMASMGNQSRLDAAKDIFKYAIIGLVVTFASYTITIFIQSIFY